MPRYLLIGLVEPPDADSEAAFNEWFVGEHVEDTARCPLVQRSALYELKGTHLDCQTVARYLSVYEVEAESFEAAERQLNAWQADPDAWSGRARHLETARRLGGVPLTIKGSGWYEEVAVYDETGHRVSPENPP